MSFLREIGRTAMHGNVLCWCAAPQSPQLGFLARTVGFKSVTLYPRLEVTDEEIRAIYAAAPVPLPGRTVAPQPPQPGSAPMYSSTIIRANQPENGEDIRILSQNLWLHYLVSSPQKKDRLLDFLSVIAQFDVLCLQEVFTLRFLGMKVASLKDWLIQEARQLGFLFWTDSGSTWIGQDSGLLILSRYPIMRSSYLTFNSFALSELPNAKGALFATIEIKSRMLHVCCTHLDAHSATCRSEQVAAIVSHLPCVTRALELPPEDDVSCPSRPSRSRSALLPPEDGHQDGETKHADQEAALARKFSFCAVTDEELVVVAGDFNIPTGSQEHRQSLLRQLRGFHDAACHSVDHVLISNSLRGSFLSHSRHFFQSQNRAVSDHEGLSIVLAWPPESVPKPPVLPIVEPPPVLRDGLRSSRCRPCMCESFLHDG